MSTKAMVALIAVLVVGTGAGIATGMYLSSSSEEPNSPSSANTTNPTETSEPTTTDGLAATSTTTTTAVGDTTTSQATTTSEPPTSADPALDEPAGVTLIPDGIDLETGLIDTGSDGAYAPTGRDGSDPGEEPWLSQMCGPEYFRPEPVDRIFAWSNGPEYADTRQLLTYGTVGEAVEVLEDVRSLTDGCESSGSREFTYPANGTGYDSFTVAETYTDGLGLVIVQITRVGNAVLIISSYSEGSQAGLADAVEARDVITRTIAAEMCIFTVAGCPSG